MFGFIGTLILAPLFALEWLLLVIASNAGRPTLNRYGAFLFECDTRTGEITRFFCADCFDATGIRREVSKHGCPRCDATPPRFP